MMSNFCKTEDFGTLQFRLFYRAAGEKVIRHQSYCNSRISQKPLLPLEQVALSYKISLEGNGDSTVW
jgi:hypothetical protein